MLVFLNEARLSSHRSAERVRRRQMRRSELLVEAALGDLDRVTAGLGQNEVERARNNTSLQVQLG